MGALTLPASGLVYLDASPIIYSVEKHPVYGPLLQPLWQAARAKTVEVVSSELTLMEALVGPLKSGDAALETAYELALLGTDMRLLPITQPILREAARLRATTKLKTPDALHAATALHAGCVLLPRQETNSQARRASEGKQHNGTGFSLAGASGLWLPFPRLRVGLVSFFLAGVIFITNDVGFRGIASLPLAILADLLTP